MYSFVRTSKDLYEHKVRTADHVTESLEFVNVCSDLVALNGVVRDRWGRGRLAVSRRGVQGKIDEDERWYLHVEHGTRRAVGTGSVVTGVGH